MTTHYKHTRADQCTLRKKTELLFREKIPLDLEIFPKISNRKHLKFPNFLNSKQFFEQNPF